MQIAISYQLQGKVPFFRAEPAPKPGYDIAPSQLVPVIVNQGELALKDTRWGLIPLGATLGLLLTLLGHPAQAQITRTWDGGGADSNWSTPGNWSSNDVPNGPGEAALFTNDPVGQTKLTPNLSANVTNGQLQFSASAPSYAITGSGASILYLSPAASFGGVGVIVASGAASQTISAAEVFFLTNQTWDIGGTTTLTVTGTIEDDSVIDYGLTKNGTGTLVFPGDVRYDGATIVNAGKLVLRWSNTSMLSALTVNGGILRAETNANSLGNSSTRNTINLAGGALELANDTGVTFGSASRITTVSGDSTVRSDRLTSGAGVTHTMGPLHIGAQRLSAAAGTFANTGTAGITFGTATLSADGAVFDVASGANLTLGALGGNFTFSKQGSGQLTLNTAANANRTSARVTLSSGIMRLGNASALGTASVPFTLDGGTLALAISGSVNAHNATVGGNATIAADRSTAGSGVTYTLGTLGIGAQTLSVTAGTNATNGTAGITFSTTTLSGNATFDAVNSGSANAQLTLGAVGEFGAACSLTKTGNGTLRLNGVGSYSGGTMLRQGAITLGIDNALGSGGFNFAGGTLNANNSTDNTIGALTLAADSTLNLSPGGASAILTFAGVSGDANGILTITGWSGSAGGLGSNDKIVFSGGTPPNAAFLQHIHFDLGGGNIYFGAFGAGGELFASATLVTTGPPPVLVPNVALLTQSDATNAVVSAGLSVGNLTSASSGTVPAGSVISQNPVAGASVAAGTPVDLVVSTGPAPIIVPAVLGLAQSAAESNLVSVGLSVGTISQTNSATVDAGFVLGQNPSAGESVPPATPIALLISTGPSVPDVVNLSQAAATNAILIAGLSVGSISNAPDGIIPAGSVISQNPTAGTSAAIGSPVDLVVSSGVTVPVLSGAAYQDGVFQLSVPTLSGRLYILEFTDELPATNWMDVQSVSGDNTLRFLTDASATNYQRYYRVRVE